MNAPAADDPLGAVIFDVDGTLVDSERHGHRVAFNQAFTEFGLPWHWDEDSYGDLLHVTGGQRRIDGYLAAHGVPEHERSDLVPALHARKTAILRTMVSDGVIALRPGVGRLLGELVAGGYMLAVGTTGSRGWVDGLLRRLLPGISWDVVVTGDDVTHRKPDPEVFQMVLERLGTTGSPGSGVVVVEDSREGLDAAGAAGLPCAVVVNGYTADHDLGHADLVLDGFGEAGSPAQVLRDPHQTGCLGVLDGEMLRRLVRCPR